jgi:hypothetical protein
MKNILLGSLIFTLLAAAVVLFGVYKNTITKVPPLIPTARLTLGDTTLKVAVADTEDKRVRGLSGQPSLPKGSGLLFSFPDSQTHGIWMKDMHFPIDIIWFDENFTIVDIQASAHPDSYPKVFTPQVNARYILETQAGFSEVHHLLVGENAVFSEVPSDF